MNKVTKILVAILVVSALAVTAFAAPFTPSVEKKDGPALIGGAIVDAEGNEVEKLDADSVVITAYAEKDDADEATRLALEAAYDSLVAAGSVEAAVPEMAGMTVRDLFHIAASDELVEKLNNGYTLALEFDMDADADEAMAGVAFDGAEWAALAEGDVAVAEDGVVNFVMRATGVFGFVVEQG